MDPVTGGISLETGGISGDEGTILVGRALRRKPSSTSGSRSSSKAGSPNKNKQSITISGNGAINLG